MKIHDQQIFLLEEFKIPFLDSFCPEDWKDWYHYIFYDPVTKTRLLYNLCFNGRPVTGYVTDTLFLTVPKGFVQHNVSDPILMETYGFARNMKWETNDLQIAPLRYHNDEIAFSIKDKLTSINISNQDGGLALNVSGTPSATPIYLPEPAPYGSGFIGWGLIPGFTMNGDILIGDKVISINENWFCYHDRNFGRFNWGNIGWTWFVLHTNDTAGKRWTYVLHKSSSNSFTKTASPMLFVYAEQKLSKVFVGATIDLQVKWRKSDTIPPILPGAMASMFGDRSIYMPDRLLVVARDETDYLNLDLEVTMHSELIVPDNKTKQYTFLKELSGDAGGSQRLHNKKSVFRTGFFYAELVH